MFRAFQVFTAAFIRPRDSEDENLWKMTGVCARWSGCIASSTAEVSVCCLDSAYQARIYDIRPGAGFLDGFEQVEKIGLDLRRIAREFYHLSKPHTALAAFLHAFQARFRSPLRTVDAFLCRAQQPQPRSPEAPFRFSGVGSMTTSKSRLLVSWISRSSSLCAQSFAALGPLPLRRSLRCASRLKQFRELAQNPRNLIV